MNYLKRNTLAIAVSLASVSASFTASAQDQGEDLDWLTLEEVVVTAQKRAQSLQDVPIPVQAVSGDMLAQNGISTLSDLSSIAPGFMLADTQGTQNTSALRGVSILAFGFGLEESIPFYLDGVYLGNGFDMLGDLLDVERVEVLKGPQGTLFGRNASGGAVSINRNKPSDEVEGEIGAGVGSYGLRTTRGVFNLPVNDELKLRAGFTTRDRDGWQTNVTTGKEDGLAQDRTSGFLRALWSVSDSLEVEYSGDFGRQKDHPGYKSISAVQPGFFELVWAGADPASFYSESNEDNATGNQGLSLFGGFIVVNPAEAQPKFIQDRKISGNALTATWDINDDLTLTSITSYRTVDTLVGTDADGGNVGMVNSWSEGKTEEFNQELRINAAWDTVDWLLGFNFYQQERELSTTTYFSSLISRSQFGGTEALTETSAGENSTDSYSLFADASWHLTDALNVTAGIRYSYDEKSYSLLDAGNDSFNGRGVIYPNHSQLPDPSTSSWEDDWSNVSGRVGLDYSFDSDVMVFASISQGYKSGGFNTRFTLEGNASDGYFSPEFASKPFGEETNINYELGVKSELLDGRLRFNSSLFYYTYNDLQVLFADGNSPVARTVNAEEFTGYGWDSELVYLATEGLTLSFNFLALDAKYTKPLEDETGVVRVVEDSARPWSPDWSATMSVNYVVGLNDLGELRTNLTYSIQDDQFMRSTQVQEAYTDEDNIQEGYSLLNGRVSFYSANEKLEVALWGRNILDEAYKSNLIGSSNSVAGVLMATRGEPRTYGLEAIYRF